MLSSTFSAGRAALKVRRFLSVSVAVISMFALIAGPASAGGDKRFPLLLAGGEDPGVIAGRTEADVRVDGKTINVNMDNLDPARFPAGCMADVTVGLVSGKATLVNQALKLPVGAAAATSMDFFTPGKADGRAVSVSINCTTMDAAGLSTVHSTLWTGTVGQPKPVKPAKVR